MAAKLPDEVVKMGFEMDHVMIVNARKHRMRLSTDLAVVPLDFLQGRVGKVAHRNHPSHRRPDGLSGYGGATSCSFTATAAEPQG